MWLPYGISCHPTTNAGGNTHGNAASAPTGDRATRTPSHATRPAARASNAIEIPWKVHPESRPIDSSPAAITCTTRVPWAKWPYWYRRTNSRTLSPSGTVP